MSKQTLVLYRTPTNSLAVTVSTLPINLIDKSRPQDLNVVGEVIDLFNFKVSFPYSPTSGVVELRDTTDLLAIVHQDSGHRLKIKVIADFPTTYSLIPYGKLLVSIQDASRRYPSEIVATKLLKGLVKLGWRHSPIRSLK